MYSLIRTARPLCQSGGGAFRRNLLTLARPHLREGASYWEVRGLAERVVYVYRADFPHLRAILADFRCINDTFSRHYALITSICRICAN